MGSKLEALAWLRAHPHAGRLEARRAGISSGTLTRALAELGRAGAQPEQRNAPELRISVGGRIELAIRLELQR